MIIGFLVNGTIIISDPNTINLVYATFGLVIATAVGIGLSLWATRKSLGLTRNQIQEMKESNKLLEIELKSKLRSLFQFVNFNVTKQENKNPVLRATLQNIGTIPARKIRMWRESTNNEKLIDILKEKNDLKNYLEIGTIQNNGFREVEEFVKYNQGQEARFFIWLEYYALDKKEESVVLCRLNPNDWNKVKQEWFIQEDIVEIRKELDDERSDKKFAPT